MDDSSSVLTISESDDVKSSTKLLRAKNGRFSLKNVEFTAAPGVRKKIGVVTDGIKTFVKL